MTDDGVEKIVRHEMVAHSRRTIFVLFIQEWVFKYVDWLSGVRRHGPSSVNKASNEEPPGPVEIIRGHL